MGKNRKWKKPTMEKMILSKEALIQTSCGKLSGMGQGASNPSCDTQCYGTDWDS